MSAARPQASQPPPLRRDREGAVLGGVCAGLGRRLGIDPIVLRVVFLAATAAGGLGVVLYLLAWVAVPAEGESRASSLRIPRVPGGRDSWFVAGGMGLLVLALLLLFRQWGLWIGDGLVWPVVLAAAGGALIWRQSASAADPAPAREEPAPVGGGSALGRAALGVALVVGAALLFLYFNDALAPRPRRAAARRRRARRRHADPRAVVDPAGARARRRACGAGALAGARRARRAPARLRPADARPDAAAGGRPARDRGPGAPPGA